MREAVIVEAVRTPIARGKVGKGDLSGFHAAELLAVAHKAVVEGTGIDPAEVGQIIGGCVTQAGEQAGNITRNAWLSMGHDFTVGGSTIDAQCGSAQRIAEHRGITRRDADELACESQRRAKEAWDNGWFDKEIVSVEAPEVDEAFASVVLSWQRVFNADMS
ncbi:MAG: hypothetical protein MI746_05400, partial [Pseudomonadales bacterium]|nr:hypothetical protein [Pseudomonadales bacterium]